MQKTNVCWRNVASKNTDNSKAYPGFKKKKKKNVNTTTGKVLRNNNIPCCLTLPGAVTGPGVS